MLRYLLGGFMNIFNPSVSMFSLIDNKSYVSRKAKVNRWARIVQSSIDDYSYIGVNTSVVGCKIGKFCSIANEVYLGMANHTLNFISTSPIFTEKHNGTGHRWIKKDIYSPCDLTEIGNDVWIGYRVIMKCGVKIGNGAIIGAGSIVTKDVPPFAIVAGSPAAIIRYRFPTEIINKLHEIEWWLLDDDELKEKINFFQEDHINEIMLNGLKHRI